MNIQSKKALITGGGSGIGFHIAKTFSENGAEVILVGRNEDKLKKSAEALNNASYIVADVSNRVDVKELAEAVSKNGGLDILINSAGISQYIPAIFGEEDEQKTRAEMDINYHAVVNMVNHFLPILSKSNEAVIVNVVSILAYVPALHAASYSASKAALHAYSQVLRLQLERETANVKVFEVFPPLTDTGMSSNSNAPKLAPEVIATDLLKAIENNVFTIRSGMTESMYQAMLASPENALTLLNKK